MGNKQKKKDEEKEKMKEILNMFLLYKEKNENKRKR